LSNSSNRTIIEENDVFRKYNFSSIISPQDESLAKTDIKTIIENGNYFKNSPKFQTSENLFSRHEPHWLKFRMSFIFSCFMHIGREVQIKNMQAWSFMTNNDIVEDREDLWHTHHLTKQNNSISGIYYLHIPEDAVYMLSGTEFAPNGITSPERVVVTPGKQSWIVYPSDQWHRPMPTQSNGYRFIIAADMEY
jgi:hypothetical protein